MPGRIQNSKFKFRKSKGLFITFEGIEGCGKTTQAKLLAKWLKQEGRRVVVTREPGGPPISEKIRRILLDNRNRGMAPMAELLLLEASRAQHTAQVIAPALKGGAIVICDRFADSSTAYQAYGRGLDPAMVQELNRVAVLNRWPDLTMVLDLPVERGFLRASGRRRGFDRMESQALRFHRAVRKGFLSIARTEPGRVKILDGAQSPDIIHAAVRQLVLAALR